VTGDSEGVAGVGDGWLAGTGVEAIAGTGSSIFGFAAGDATGCDWGVTFPGDSVLSPSCVMAKAAKR